ncbi:K02A2.6-like [Cordylochernes scorpioides]|uniref:K02A2.6-like n=1 Tax=Cordylochernes scorpioides TaxID=51811 RepID=A0ABY6K3G2_9ARAC|nr:K02A2.6-like [Cordylochernes scorpioides]
MTVQVLPGKVLCVEDPKPQQARAVQEPWTDPGEDNVASEEAYIQSYWISNLVLVKSTKKLRICIDPRELNVALKRAEYPIPTIEEIIPNLQNAKIFTVVDTKDGFWNVKLSDESSNLTTFWTPFGRYKFLRMPFGLKTASEEYQRRLYEIFQGLEGIEIIADDILILGKAGRGSRIQQQKKAVADVEYPAYGVTGPGGKDSASSSPPGDRKLAHSAHMYHYQHQKQQMIAVEK